MEEVTFSVNRSVLTVVPGVGESDTVAISKEALVNAVKDRKKRLVDFDTDVSKILDALKPEERKQIFAGSCAGFSTGIAGYLENRASATDYAKKRNVFLVATALLLIVSGLGIKFGMNGKALTGVFGGASLTGLVAGIQVIRGGTQSTLAKTFESTAPYVIWDYDGKYFDEVQTALKP